MSTTKPVNNYTVISLFPEFIESFSQIGIVRRACENGHVAIDTINPRSCTTNGRGQVDDAPYGGGPGMVMSVPPLRRAIKRARDNHAGTSTVAYLSPQGRKLTQRVVQELTEINHLVLVAGRYEGIDERIIERDIDMQISLGDFVLSGGEIAAMAIIDAIVRLLPGSLGSEDSAAADSFSDGLLEHAHYTRPESVDGQQVPATLLGGNHAEIARWRRKQMIERTWKWRPDLLEGSKLTSADRQMLEQIVADIAAAGDDTCGED